MGLHIHQRRSHVIHDIWAEVRSDWKLSRIDTFVLVLFLGVDRGS